jgi:hypothetical protein
MRNSSSMCKYKILVAVYFVKKIIYKSLKQNQKTFKFQRVVLISDYDSRQFWSPYPYIMSVH